jgi:hypothetical protein
MSERRRAEPRDFTSQKNALRHALLAQDRLRTVSQRLAQIPANAGKESMR